MIAFAKSLISNRMQVDARERWRAFVGAGVGIFITALLSRWLISPSLASAWLVAPLGASAVLVFAVPASPMAQPWSVIGGNTLSALVGIGCANFIHDPALAAAVAVGGAIALMFACRCLHPPGGASALLAVLIHATDYRFAMLPVLLNSALLVASGMLYNSLTGRAYPHRQKPKSDTGADTLPGRFSAADLDAALKHYNQVLDVSRNDLEQLLHETELQAYRRNFGDLRCREIMSTDPVSVTFGTLLQDAWATMRSRKVKALPVVDGAQRIVGIVTMADFLREAQLDDPQGIGDRLRQFIRKSGTTHSDKPEVVGQIMTRRVRVIGADRHIIELVPVFSHGGHHHIPVIDAENRLVGIITQTDLVQALYRAVKPE